MVSKNITIMKDAYEALVKEKKTDESFSDVIRRLTSKKKSIMDFAGILEDKEAEKIKKTIYEMRKKSDFSRY